MALTKYIHDVFEVTELGLCLDEWPNSLDWTFDGTRELIDILRLDDGLEIIFEDFGEVVCIELVFRRRS